MQPHVDGNSHTQQNGSVEGKQGNFNEVMAAIMLSRALCLRGRACVGFLAVWECIAMCFSEGNDLVYWLD